jgi:hypothetical protein
MLYEVVGVSKCREALKLRAKKYLSQAGLPERVPDIEIGNTSASIGSCVLTTATSSLHRALAVISKNSSKMRLHCLIGPSQAFRFGPMQGLPVAVSLGQHIRRLSVLHTRDDVNWPDGWKNLSIF